MVSNILERLGRFLERRGIPVFLLFAGVVLLLPLGRTGLWGPWEMDRADMAKTFHESPLVPVILEPGPDNDVLAAAVVDGANDAEVRLDYVKVSPARGRRLTGLGPLTEALSTVGTHMVGGLIVDVDLFVRPKTEETDLGRVAPKLLKALNHANGAHVMLLSSHGSPGFEGRVHAAVDSAHWAALAGRMCFFCAKTHKGSKKKKVKGALALEDDPAFKVFVDGLGNDFPAPTDRLKIFVDADGSTLGAAIRASIAASFQGVGFKKKGQVHMAPPLDTWMISASYQLFGVSEFSTRLPNALFGLLTLFLLVWMVRRIWDPWVALLSGLVLLTTPLFFAQATSAVGETALMLGNTLVAAGILLRSERYSDRCPWVLAALGIVLLFFSKGLFGVSLGVGLMVLLPLLSGDRKMSQWRPALVFGTLFLALIALVQAADPGSAAGQFRFTQSLFSAGPSAYHLNFDLFVYQLGFGGFPWSPLYLLALAWIVFSKEIDSQRNHLLIVWFALPVLLMMATLSDFYHFLWPAVPAAAVLVALFLAHLARQGQSNTLMAFLVVLMGMILVRELGKEPRPLAALLAFDPPFSEKGAGRFPEELKLSSMAKLAYAGSLFFLVVHLTRLWSATAKLRRVFRRQLPFAIAVGSALSLFSAIIFMRVYIAFSSTMELRSSKVLSQEQREFAGRFLGSADAGVALAWTLLGMAAVIFGLHAWPMLRRSVGRIPSPKWLNYGPQAALMLAWIAAGIALATVSTPLGYWGEVLSGGTLGCLLLGVALLAALKRWPQVLDVRFGSAATALGVVSGLSLTVTLARDTASPTLLLTALVVASTFVYGIGVARWMWRDWAKMVLGSGLMVTGAVLLLTLPLLDRYDTIAEALDLQTLGDYLAWQSKLSWAVYLGIGALVVNRVHGETSLAVRLSGLAVRAERGLVAVIAMVFAGLVVAGSTLYGLYDDLSLHVSEQHLIASYCVGEGHPDGLCEIGENFYRFGSFAPAGQKNRNFYTRAVPRVGDRDAALRILLGDSDQVVQVQTAGGEHVTRSLHGWDSANDLDGDGVRDFSVVRGQIASVSPGRLEASSDIFAGLELTGHVVRDATGKVFNVVGNDAKSLMLGDLDLLYTAATGSRARKLPRRTLELVEPASPFIIGRGAGSAVQLLRGDVASRHASIVCQAGACRVDPLQQERPTLLNGTTITTATLLKAGDVLEVAQTRMEVVHRTPSMKAKLHAQASFVVDSAQSSVSTATASKEKRNYLLVPTTSFSNFNFNFRKKSGGRHIPIINGRSIRALLAASSISEGEEQSNRYALHTLTRADFDDLRRRDSKVVGAAPGENLANFGDKIHILGYRLEEKNVSSGQTLELRVYMLCASKGAPNRGCTVGSYKIFIHMDMSGGGGRIGGDHYPLNLSFGAEEDKKCLGCYQTDHWLPGDVVIDVYEKEIPTGTASGTRDMWFGFYKGKKRLDVIEADTTRVRIGQGKNSILLGSFQVP